MPKYEFYAVAKGRKTGIYTNWDDCKLQTEKFKGPKFKGFHSKREAQKFIDEFQEKERPKMTDRNLLKSSNTTDENNPKPDQIHFAEAKEGWEKLANYSTNEIYPHEFKTMAELVKDNNNNSCEDDIDNLLGSSVELELDDTEFSDDDDTSDSENFEEISVFNVKHVPTAMNKGNGDGTESAQTPKGVFEIEAITSSIQKIRSKKHHLIGIKINTDLLNATHNCRFWLPRFKKEGWIIYGKPVPMAFKEALEEFDKAKAGIRITWNCFKRY